MSIWAVDIVIKGKRLTVNKHKFIYTIGRLEFTICKKCCESDTDTYQMYECLMFKQPVHC